jgi:hypothetical protein
MNEFMDLSMDCLFDGICLVMDFVDKSNIALKYWSMVNP